MRICIVPGSFDPITLGHIDIIMRAMRQYDQVIVAVLDNRAKSNFFSMQERIDMIKSSLADFESIQVKSFGGLLIDFAKEEKACAIVRGLRAVMDFEYEFQMAALNRSLDPSIETVFLMTKADYMFISSSAIKDIGLHKGDISSFVPQAIHQRLVTAFSK